MDAFWAIALFVIISIVADKLEGSKKKKVPKRPKNPVPQPAKPPEQEKIKFKIPPIFKAPQSEKPDNTVSIPPAEPPMPKYEVPKPAAVWKEAKMQAAVQPQAATGEIGSTDAYAAKRQMPNIHTEVIMNAIMYAQILDPPKAYKYMARRRRRN